MAGHEGDSAGSGARNHRNGRQRLRPLSLVLLTAFALLLTLSAPAQAKYASLVIDADTGQVLHSVNADTRNYPASLTKMMTLYMVFEALRQGRITMDTKWTASNRVARQPASRLGLRRGETIAVRDAIYALITKSANDVATLVAESLGGSERDFALAMTARARALGMSKTTFRNASGLGNRGQLSTARDIISPRSSRLRSRRPSALTSRWPSMNVRRIPASEITRRRVWR